MEAVKVKGVKGWDMGRFTFAGVAILGERDYDEAMIMISFHHRRCALLLAALLLFSIRVAAAGESFPRPVGAVNDFAGVISDQDKGPMERLAAEVLEKTGTAVVVATVETIGDGDPTDYANRLYQAWGIGKKGEDKGVLILLALKERQVRIETGYGVEGIIPDGMAGEILDRYALPRFRAGDYGKGLAETMAAVSSIAAEAAGVRLTGAAPRPRQVGTGKGIGIGQLSLLVLAAALLFGTRRGRAMLPWLLVMMMGGGGGRRDGSGGGFGGFGGGFGGFGGYGGGMSGGGGAGRGF